MDGNKKPPLYNVCDLDYLLCTDNTKQWWGNKKQSVVIYWNGLPFCIEWGPFFFCGGNKMESRNMYMYMLSGDSVLKMAATVYYV